MNIYDAISIADRRVAASEYRASDLVVTSVWDLVDEFGVMLEERGVLSCHDVNGLSVSRPLVVVNKSSGRVRFEFTSPAAPTNGYQQIPLEALKAKVAVGRSTR